VNNSVSVEAGWIVQAEEGDDGVSSQYQEVPWIELSLQYADQILDLVRAVGSHRACSIGGQSGGIIDIDQFGGYARGIKGVYVIGDSCFYLTELCLAIFRLELFLAGNDQLYSLWLL